MAVGRTACVQIVSMCVIVFCSQSCSYPEENFDRPSYLATALRLSVPGLGHEATEEEIMKDIQRLENNEPAAEFDSDEKYEIRPEKRYMEFPGKRYMEFPGKRYMEFPGKRYMEFPGKRYTEFPGKRYSEFPGKRFVEFPGKRYFEFPGKRDVKSIAEELNSDKYYGNKVLSKRYHEFLGKRNSVSNDNDMDVYKRWSEFLGKRSKEVGNQDDDLTAFLNKANSENVQEGKRFSEFIG